jgi:Protein of unknown function (DUF3108)
MCATLALPLAHVSARDDKHEIVARPTPLPFEPAEELIYVGEFSKLLLRGIEIAEFRFTAEHAPANAPAVAGNAPSPNLVFKGDVNAKGWFRKLFGVDFHYNMESTVEPQTFRVLRTTKLDEQGKRVRASETIFDRTQNLLTWTERNPNDPSASPRVVRRPLGGAMHDLLSAIYYLRTQQLTPGQSLEVVMSDAGEVFRIPVRAVERKRMKTVLGKVQTLRVDIGLFGTDRLIRGREGNMTLWLTDDARRIPVRAHLDTDIGALDIKLKKVSGATVK